MRPNRQTPKKPYQAKTRPKKVLTSAPKYNNKKHKERFKTKHQELSIFLYSSHIFYPKKSLQNIISNPNQLRSQISNPQKSPCMYLPVTIIPEYPPGTLLSIIIMTTNLSGKKKQRQKRTNKDDQSPQIATHGSVLLNPLTEVVLNVS